MKAILIEYINEFGDWAYYEVNINSDCKKSLKKYAYENDIKGKLNFSEYPDGYVYLNKTFNSYGIARAEIINLIDLKNYN